MEKNNTNKNITDTRGKDSHLEEDEQMNAIIDNARPCTITESIIQTCKEVKIMREGKLPKNDLQDLWDSIEKWKTEDKEK